MKLINKFKNMFAGENPTFPDSDTSAVESVDPIEPGKVPLRRLMRALSRGFRLPARRRVYRKRKSPVRFDEGGRPIFMSFRRARLHDIHTSMREANEIRRSHRERQLERRAA